MTDLRLEIARAIGATMRLPNHMDRADEVLKAIEAAGYAVVKSRRSRARRLSSPRQGDLR